MREWALFRRIYYARDDGSVSARPLPDGVRFLDGGAPAERGRSLTSDGTITGTPLFLAPEAITDPDRVDARSDLYALGGVAYCLLTGVHVFEGASVVEVCAHHLHTRPAPPSERLGRALPPALEVLVLQCLEKDPKRRPSSARALLERLAEDLDTGDWSEAAAFEWWREREARRAAAARPASSVAASSPGLTQALTVELRGREPVRS